MTLRYDQFSRLPGIVYYQSFTGYRLPPKLKDPVLFAQTKNLASFYIARKERSAWWYAKIFVEKHTGRSFHLLKPCLPGTTMFFDADTDRPGQAEPGCPI